LRAGGCADVKQINGALGEAELADAVKGVHLLGIRSKTQITKKVIESADKPLAIGAFCIGVSQVDLTAATKKGSFELRGKTLGIIGYGNIGSQVSAMAGSMGMHVVYYDIATKLPLGNVKQIRQLKEVLKQSL
jgi:D-3-phosphoglycerate dehydrogenase